MNKLQKCERSYGRVVGAVPAETKCYVLIMFDISDIKKYNVLTKLLKRYAYRIQNSVYEAYMTPSNYRSLVCGIDKIMSSKRYFNPNDRIRLYRMTGSCGALVYGPCNSELSESEENIFF